MDLVLRLLTLVTPFLGSLILVVSPSKLMWTPHPQLLSQKKLTDEIFVAPSPRTNRVGQPTLSPSRSSSSPNVAPSNTSESNTEGNEAEKKKAEEKNNEEKEDGKKKADENGAETKKWKNKKKLKKKKRPRERNQ